MIYLTKWVLFALILFNFFKNQKHIFQSRDKYTNGVTWFGGAKCFTTWQLIWGVDSKEAGPILMQPIRKRFQRNTVNNSWRARQRAGVKVTDLTKYRAGGIINICCQAMFLKLYWDPSIKKNIITDLLTLMGAALFKLFIINHLV